MLYRWNNGKFENKYLKKLKRNWSRKDKLIQKDEARSFSRSRNLEGGVILDMQSLNANFFI